MPSSQPMVTGVSAPVVCTNRSATAAGWTGRALPAASGLPAALSAPSCTESAGSTCSSEPTAGSSPCGRRGATASSGWENCALRAGMPARRQSPPPQTSA
ncbi:Uncharacterised protein [Mycobacterium tuberculosis]|nr:Uncharacterised protein [Mycobacterium tuberculosis]